MNACTPAATGIAIRYPANPRSAMMTRIRLTAARRQRGMVCQSWTLRRGQPDFFGWPSASASNIPANMNRRGHFFGSGGGTTTVSADEGVEEEIDSVSASFSFSFSFLDFLLLWEIMTSPECLRARLLA